MESRASWRGNGRASLFDISDYYEVLDAFPHYHNNQKRPYGRTSSGKIQDDAFPTLPEFVENSRLLRPDHGCVFRHRVTSNGTIHVNKEVLYIGKQQVSNLSNLGD